MSIRVGIVGISGYGGGEALRLVAATRLSSSSTPPARAAPAAGWSTASPACRPSWPSW